MMRIIILLMSSFLFVNECFGAVATTSKTNNASFIEKIDAPTQNKIDLKTFVTYFVDRTLEIIHKPKISDQEITNESIPLMDSHVSTEGIAKFSVGPKYRELSTQQRELFLRSFRNMLASRFAGALKSALDKYKSVNAKFIVKDVKTAEKGRHYIVTSILSISTDVIEISWSIFVVNGVLKIFNMNVSGINLGQILREEIGSNIKQSGFAKFLKDFQEKYGS